MKKQGNRPSDIILQILINKFRVNPEVFQSYLPEIIPEIEKIVSSTKKRGNASELTEIERDRLYTSLLCIPRGGLLPRNEAVAALEYCATLIQDESLPDEIDRKVILNFISGAITTSLSNIDKISNIPISDGEETKILAVLRGVYLHLTWRDKLVAISISPTKMKERPYAMRFIGIGEDIGDN